MHLHLQPLIFISNILTTAIHILFHSPEPTQQNHLASTTEGNIIYGCLFIHAVGALRVTQLRVARSKRVDSHRKGGGALGTRMNLFDRFARVVKV